MTEKNQDAELKKQLKSELERSILIDEEDRKLWLSNLDTLPLPIVRNLLKTLVPGNAQVDSYIETALARDQNQEHLLALRKQVAAIKKQAFKLEEKGTVKSEKEQGEELLKKLDQV
jgi:hypothetical protein